MERYRLYIPAIMKAEIVQVVKQYPDGLSYASFLLAYECAYNKTADLPWLHKNELVRFRQIAAVIPELEMKIVNGQEKLHFVSQRRPTKNLYGLMDGSTIPEPVKYNIEKILKQYPEGILEVHFEMLYEEKLDLHDLGYYCILDLVADLPDIVIRVESPEIANNWKLFHTDCYGNIKDDQQASTAMKNMPIQKNYRFSHSKEGTVLNIAPPALEYFEAELPANSTDRLFPVFISAFINPHLFWCQQNTEEANSILKKLMVEMNFFYDAQECDTYKLKDIDILIGSSCVAFLSCNNHWYRCVIASFINTEDVQVYIVDFGSWEIVPRKHLYYLKYSFILVPAQAFRAQLALVQPTDKVESWNEDAKTRFLTLCSKTSVRAKVKTLQSGIASLFLWNVSEKAERYINVALVNEGLAKYSPSDKSGESLNESRLTNSQSSFSVLTHFNNGSRRTSNLTNAIVKKFKELQLSKNRKDVRRILLGDGYQIHILIVEEAAFVSGDDLCNLLWKGEKADTLACRLGFKEVLVPTFSVSKEKYADLFAQCERYGVGGFTGINNYSVMLYPLKYSLKVLNMFGHPSLKIREKLIQEIREFNPNALVWKKSEADAEHHDDLIEGSSNDFNRLCVHDLKVKREALVCKRLQVLKSHESDENMRIKLEEIESISNVIIERIKEIEEICLKYSEETSDCN